MFGYVYLTTNLVNNRKYIGQHRASEFTTDYKGSGKLIKQAFKKYGWDNFEVELLQECSTEEELNESEIKWIAEYEAVYSEEFYNIAYGGSHSWHPLQDWEKEQRSNEMKKRWEDPEYRERMSNMLRDKQADGNSWMVGRKHSDETKHKMSESRRGDKHPMYGKHHSDESRRKMSESAKRRNHLPTTLGRIWINNGEFSKVIRPEELDHYISKGFTKGRLIGRTSA